MSFGKKVKQDIPNYHDKPFNEYIFPVNLKDHDIFITQPIALYNFVIEFITYKHDPDQYGKDDYWASVDQTLSSQMGDCEDTAILLTNLLLGADHKARFALGWYLIPPKTYHAWPVIKLKKTWYVMETTYETKTDILIPCKTEEGINYETHWTTDGKNVYSHK